MLNTVALSLPFNVNRNFTRVLVVVKLATNCTCTECKEKKTKVLLVAFFFCSEKWVINSIFDNRLRSSPPFFLRDSRASETRGVIFTRTRVSHALLSLRKNGGLLEV